MKLTEAFEELGYVGGPLTARQYSAPAEDGTEIVTLWAENRHEARVGIIHLTSVALDRLALNDLVRVVLITPKDPDATPRTIDNAEPLASIWRIVHLDIREKNGRPMAVIVRTGIDE